MKMVKVLLFFLFLLFGASVHAEVTLNIAVANPSESRAEIIPVKYALPPMVQREDILDSGGLKAEYNEAEGVYYLEGEVALSPKEVKRIRVRLRDVWFMPEEEIESLKIMLEERVESIQDEDKKETAQLLGDDLMSKLDGILRSQDPGAVSIEERMNLYPVNSQRLRRIKDKIFSLNSLIGIYQRGEEQDPGTVNLFVEARNLSDRGKEVPIKYYLPEGVIPEYIVDRGGFEVSYDPGRGQFFLHMEEAFGPEEVKRFIVEIRNIWHVEEAVIEQYLTEAEELNERLSITEAAVTARELVDAIEENAEAILSSQAAVETVKERIAVYRLNRERLAVMEDNLTKLRELVAEFPEIEISAQAEAVQQLMERIETFTQVELGQMAERLAETLRLVGVWRIVYTIILFIIGITVFFYGLWFFRLKKEDKRRFEKK